jgi:hypothetical protein
VRRRNPSLGRFDSCAAPFRDRSLQAGVEVLYGTSGGLRVTNDDFFQEDDLSSTDGPEQNDNFGLSLPPRPSSYGWYWLG